MRFVGLPKLEFDFIPVTGIRILQEKIQPPSPRLNALLVLENQVSETQQRWIFSNPLLNPTFFEFRV